MYSHILVTVAYDAGHDASASLQAARRLAADGAQITLIHVMDPPPAFTLDYLPAGWRSDLKAAIESDLAELISDWDNASVILTEGDPAQQILETARMQRVDCIVIASHRPGMRGPFLGSTANKVVSRANCAVHVVRRE